MRGCWEYVLGKAFVITSASGTRDAGNEGKTVEDFLSEMNEHIRSRRLRIESERLSSGGTTSEAGMMLLPEEHAYLTREEIIALRLYTGPAYQPINAFFRRIAQARPRNRHVTDHVCHGHVRDRHVIDMCVTATCVTAT